MMAILKRNAPGGRGLKGLGRRVFGARIFGIPAPIVLLGVLAAWWLWRRHQAAAGDGSGDLGGGLSGMGGAGASGGGGGAGGYVFVPPGVSRPRINPRQRSAIRQRTRARTRARISNRRQSRRAGTSRARGRRPTTGGRPVTRRVTSRKARG